MRFAWNNPTSHSNVVRYPSGSPLASLVFWLFVFGFPGQASRRFLGVPENSLGWRGGDGRGGRDGRAGRVGRAKSGE